MLFGLVFPSFDRVSCARAIGMRVHVRRSWLHFKHLFSSKNNRRMILYDSKWCSIPWTKECCKQYFNQSIWLNNCIASHLSTKSTTLHSQLDTLLFACLKYFPNERNHNNNSNNKTVFWCKLKRVSASNFCFDFHCKWIELLVWFCFSSSWFDFASAQRQ